MFPVARIVDADPNHWVFQKPEPQEGALNAFKSMAAYEYKDGKFIITMGDSDKAVELSPKAIENMFYAAVGSVLYKHVPKDETREQFIERVQGEDPVLRCVPYALKDIFEKCGVFDDLASDFGLNWL